MNTLTASNHQTNIDLDVNNESVILFEGVSVRYRVPRERVSGIKEFAIRWLQRRLAYEEFWAVRDVSFEVRNGEVFGIIGRNGAGKSTMLKVMARVLQPTQGRVVMRGRLAPLLELGGGFHPELNGRENVYLNMALLGYSHAQTDHLFDSIVEFSEIGDFIDAPLRTYSTGMVARLGFSVATCVRPDILLVDEVLSVGDNRFQEKCLERMKSFRDLGTTIVIVSHSMNTVSHFCSRALWLDHGEVQAMGDVDKVIEQYAR
jgi:ABC-type polysaccharide/polyol phosphate transport system ATPase subunit